jgi:MFS family permease
LLSVRLSGQFADGVFQASLAGTVLFNPERQAHAADIAAGFAVLLLPYSVLGPFCGVLLDRWWRQRVLQFANLIRALLVCVVAVEIAAGWSGAPLYLSALCVISVNRFVLSALSACLPHVVELDRLITANAISTTAGAVVGAAGGAAAIGLRVLAGGGNAGYALIAVGAGACYLLAGLRARGFGRAELGPDDDTRGHSDSVRHVLIGLRDGGREIRSQPAVVRGLAMIGLHRFAYGVTAITILLLYRNYFVADGIFRAGLSGLGQVVTGIAIGGGLAAVLTPPAVARWGFLKWPAALLMLAGVAEFALGLPFKLQTILPAALVLGFVSQGVKICVDTTVAQQIADDFRGRVFTLYDTMFNVVFVAAGALTAIALPESGHSPVAVIVTGAFYLVLGTVYLRIGAHPDQPACGLATGPDPVRSVPSTTI